MKYKSVNEMIWKLSGWKFKIKWFWLRFVQWFRRRVNNGR